MADVVATREDAEGLALEPLVVLDALEGELGLRDLEIDRAAAGHSNVTFFLRSGGEELVLRRPPRPPFAPTAHDVLREHGILAALAGTGARVPKVVSVCMDPGVIGAPFYVMGRVEGIVVDAATPPPLDNPADRSRMAAELIAALVELHDVDWRRSGLARIGKPGGYLRRQIGLWTKLWRRNRTREVPAVDELGSKLAAAIPESPEATLVHGDYKLDNVVFDASSPARLVAILDWEMATIGDPIADVGFLTATWLHDDEPAERLLGLSSATAEPGFPRRGELAERYAEASGRDLSSLAWYQALALWKLAILLEGSFKRFKAGTTDDPFFARLERGVPGLAADARAALGGALLES